MDTNPSYQVSCASRQEDGDKNIVSFCPYFFCLRGGQENQGTNEWKEDGFVADNLNCTLFKGY